MSPYNGIVSLLTRNIKQGQSNLANSNISQCGCRMQILLISSIMFDRWQHASRSWSWWCIWDSHLGRGRRKSAMVRVVSYRLFFMTITLSLTIRSQFAIECIRRSNDHGVDQFGTKFGEEGTDRCKPNINTI